MKRWALLLHLHFVPMVACHTRILHSRSYIRPLVGKDSWRRLMVEDHRRRRGNVLPTEGWTICMRTDINSGIACLSLGRFFFFDSSSTHLWSGSCFFFSNLSVGHLSFIHDIQPSVEKERWRRRNRFVNQTMTSSKSKETSGGWSLINHVLRTPTASSPLWSGSRIFFLLLSSNLRLGTLVIWYPRTKCYQSAWKEKKEKEKIRDSSQPLTGHWRPNFSRPSDIRPSVALRSCQRLEVVT